MPIICKFDMLVELRDKYQGIFLLHGKLSNHELVLIKKKSPTKKCEKVIKFRIISII